MRNLLIAGTMVVLCASTASAQHQANYTFELHGGAAFPIEDFGDGSLNTGAGFGIAASFRMFGKARLHGGWDRHRFTTQEPFGGQDFNVQQTGYTIGIQLERAISKWSSTYGRAALVYSHIQLADATNQVVVDTNHKLGWEVSLGVTSPIQQFVISHGLRFRTLSTGIESGSQILPSDLSYIAVELAIAWAPSARTVTAARWR